MKPEIRVNRKFLFIFVTIQCILVGLILYAFLSPKTVTVQVVQRESSYDVELPLEVYPPKV